MNVSVVIPTLDVDNEFIWGAIDSAHKAGARQVNVTIDGRRGDHIREPYETYDTGDVTYIETIHAGVCHARNLGIFQSHYNLIVPLDADDELLPDSLQPLVEAWEPGTLVYGNWLEAGPVGQSGEGFDTLKFAPPPEMLNRKHVAHATWLFHKDDWARVGGFDPDFNIGGEDWAFMCALVEAGVKPIRIDKPIYRRTVRAGSRTDQARSRIDFIKQLLREKYPKVMAG